MLAACSWGVCVFYASSGGGSIGFLSASCLLGSVATMCTYALVFLPSTSWLPMRLIFPVDNQMSFHLQAISHSIHLCNKAAQFLITVPIPEGLGKPISRILPHLPNPPAACPQRKKLRQKTTSVPAADRAQVCPRTGGKVPKDGPLCPEILQPGVGVESEKKHSRCGDHRHGQHPDRWAGPTLEVSPVAHELGY